MKSPAERCAVMASPPVVDPGQGAGSQRRGIALAMRSGLDDRHGNKIACAGVVSALRDFEFNAKQRRVGVPGSSSERVPMRSSRQRSPTSSNPSRITAVKNTYLGITEVTQQHISSARLADVFGTPILERSSAL